MILTEEMIFKAMLAAKAEQDEIIKKSKGDRKWIQDILNKQSLG